MSHTDPKSTLDMPPELAQAFMASMLEGAIFNFYRGPMPSIAGPVDGPPFLVLRNTPGRDRSLESVAPHGASEGHEVGGPV